MKRVRATVLILVLALLTFGCPGGHQPNADTIQATKQFDGQIMTLTSLNPPTYKAENGGVLQYDPPAGTGKFIGQKFKAKYVEGGLNWTGADNDPRTYISLVPIN